MNIEYTKYPKAVESALQQLALYKWDESVPPGHPQREMWEKYMGWCGFDIPFVLTINDDLLSSPRVMPNLSRLKTEPIFDSQGEEIGEIPAIYIRLDEGKTEVFKKFIQHTENLLEGLKNRWQFLDVALGYFIKAFFVEGLEQLLWHITVLEALLGEKGDGVTERLARRIVSILGKSENEKKELKKQFREIYEFRSDLVHGNIFKKEVLDGHLRVARSFARQTLLWFLHYLKGIQDRVLQDQATESIPTRDDILMLLDLDRNSRLRLSRLMGSVPEEFPYVREWVE